MIFRARFFSPPACLFHGSAALGAVAVPGLPGRRKGWDHMEPVINTLIIGFLAFLFICVLIGAHNAQQRDERRRAAAAKLQADNWTDFSFDQGVHLFAARKANWGWQLFREDGEAVPMPRIIEKPEFYDGFWYCKTHDGTWSSYVYYDDQGNPVSEDYIRDATKRLLVWEKSKEEQQCATCAHCVDNISWVDVLTFADTDYRFSCEEGIMSTMMNEWQTQYNSTAPRCSKYKRR